MSTDLVNGSFEVLGAFIQILNIIQLRKDKTVKGVNWLVTAFFALWGLWNCYFYPVNGFVLSAIGSILIFITNTVWVLLLFHYKNKQNNGT